MADRYYTIEEVDQMLLAQRNALMEYIDKQIKLGNSLPNPDETSLYMEVKRTETQEGGE